MMTLNLSDQLSGHAFAYVLVFTRIGAGMMMFPGIGESFVPSRIRLLFSLALSLLVYIPLLPILPAMPAGTADMVLMLFRESLVGFFFGSVMRLMVDVLETAGSVVSMQLGLSNAMMLNPTMASQSSLTSALFTTIGLVLIFVTGMDHFLLRALLDTYDVFPPNTILPPNDVVQTYTQLMTKSFSVGVELAAPLLIIGLILFTIMGFMQRLMPQVQLFLVLIPMQIWGGLFILSITITMIMTVWLGFFNDSIANLFVR